MIGSFDFLSPDSVLHAAEEAYELSLDGTLQPYPSYVNRVYGLQEESGAPFVVKFYRPGRWRREAILEEHRFLLDCAEAELPVVAPLMDADGDTLAELTVGGEEGDTECFFALYPKRGGRSFDAERDEDDLELLPERRRAAGRLSRSIPFHHGVRFPIGSHGSPVR